MAKTTFSGPVLSNNGFTPAGSSSVVQLAAGNTTLTYDDHVGRVIEVNDADIEITLPTISDTTIGATYKFFIGTDSTGAKILTDGTDKFSGNLFIAGGSGEARGFASDVSSNDVISMNGTTTGGDKGSTIEIVAIADNEYLVTGMLIGSGSAATPFADS